MRNLKPPLARVAANEPRREVPVRVKGTPEILELHPIKISQIQPNPGQPRRGIEPYKLKELAASIKEVGLLSPILVRPNGKNFEIVHGERRFKACKKLKFKTIRAEVRELDDREAFLIAFTENLQRENLDPIEEAQALSRLINDFEHTQDQAGEILGKSQQYVADRLSLLRLPEPIQDMITARAVSPSVGRMLARHDDQEKVEELAMEVAEGRLTVRGLGQILRGEDPEPGTHLEGLPDDYCVCDLLIRKVDTTQPIHKQMEYVVHTARRLAKYSRYNPGTIAYSNEQTVATIENYRILGGWLKEVEKRYKKLAEALDRDSRGISWPLARDLGYMAFLAAIAVSIYIRDKPRRNIPVLAEAFELLDETGKKRLRESLKKLGWIEFENGEMIVHYEPPFVSMDGTEWSWTDLGLDCTAAGVSENASKFAWFFEGVPDEMKDDLTLPWCSALVEAQQLVE